MENFSALLPHRLSAAQLIKFHPRSFPSKPAALECRLGEASRSEREKIRKKYIFNAIFIFLCFTRKSVIVRATNSKHDAPEKVLRRATI